MTYRAPINQPTVLPHTQPRVTPDVFGTLFSEIVTPYGHPDPNQLPGWEVRTWPVARLGDATLEARPLYPHLTPEHLHRDLERAGVQVLGPIRQRR